MKKDKLENISKAIKNLLKTSVKKISGRPKGLKTKIINNSTEGVETK